MGNSKEDIELAVKRISNIIKNDKVNIICVNVSDENTIYLELENGMNFELSASEVMYQADEERGSVEKFDRHEIRQAIADRYIQTIQDDLNMGDQTVLNALLMGEGMTPLDKMSDENLVAEYKELFNKDIIIND